MRYDEREDRFVREFYCPLRPTEQCSSDCAWLLDEYENAGDWVQDSGESRCAVEMIALSLWKPVGFWRKVGILLHDFTLSIRRFANAWITGKKRLYPVGHRKNPVGNKIVSGD